MDFYKYEPLDDGTYRAATTTEYKEALSKNVALVTDEGERWEPGMPVVAPLKTFGDKDITSYFSMFLSCEAKSLDLSLFDTSKVTDMMFMFCGCNLLETINLSSFDTSNVTRMLGMFEICESLKELDLSNFNTERVTTMNCMFIKCLSLQKLNLSSFNTERVEDMYYMFSGCLLKVLDISSFTITDKTIVEYMLDLYGKTATTIYVKDESVIEILSAECDRCCEEYKLRHPDDESTDYGEIYFEVKGEAMQS